MPRRRNSNGGFNRFPWPVRRTAADGNGSIARGGLGWKLPVSRRGARRLRERPLSHRFDAHVERGEQPVIELHRSLDRKIVTDRKGSFTPRAGISAEEEKLR
jgi:hypothetical protein